jgi:hypothetical protein
MATTHRSLALSVSLAAMLAGTTPALSAELKDPLSPLTSAKGSMLCFRRDYSPAHLAQHPKQTTKSVLLAFQEGFVSIVVTPRIGARKVIGAGCGWAPGARIDTSGHKMIPNFNKPAGFRSQRNCRLRAANKPSGPQGGERRARMATVTYHVALAFMRSGDEGGDCCL